MQAQRTTSTGVSGQPDGESVASGSAPHESPSEAMRDATSKFAELGAYAAQYLGATLDKARLSARRLILVAVLGITALLVAVASIAIALVMLFTGLAQAIAAALGGRMWAGNLIVGGGLLVLLVIGLMIAMASIRKAAKKATVAKYERAEYVQRTRFGRSASDRAASVGKVEL